MNSISTRNGTNEDAKSKPLEKASGKVAVEKNCNEIDSFSGSSDMQVQVMTASLVI